MDTIAVVHAGRLHRETAHGGHIKFVQRRAVRMRNKTGRLDAFRTPLMGLPGDLLLQHAKLLGQFGN